MTRAVRRLVPLLGVCFFVSIIDRTNVSVAALTMNAELGLSAAAYGFGAGIFFVAYFLFELPSNLALERFGARRWLARIMVTWGVISVGMAFIQNDVTFYLARFLLGAAEAGFFPGVVYYLYQWFDGRNIARVLALFSAFGPLANAVGAPLATSIMQAWGWRWVYVIEGIPAVLLAFVLLRALPDSIEDARWLSATDRRALREGLGAGPARPVSWRTALRDPQSVLMCLQYLLIMTSSYALVLWLPQIIRSFDVGIGLTGWLTAVPFAVATVGLLAWGRSSARSGETLWHAVLPCLVAAAAFVAGAFTRQPAAALVLLSVGAAAIYCAPVGFWSLPRTFVSGAAAATATAMANSFGNLGGFVGPYLNGWIRDATGSFELGLALFGLPVLLGGLLTFVTIRMARPVAALAKGGRR
ncbi:MFS transporter [Pseudonocardia acaciae]|uniref:MFS transporter n=1 Tax=Pseudonocardia acaciae TaxID=551276 RepID=UPI00147004A9|nr:MFS transporter [Pseudonocardia acaciae]